MDCTKRRTSVVAYYAVFVATNTDGLYRRGHARSPGHAEYTNHTSRTRQTADRDIRYTAASSLRAD